MAKKAKRDKTEILTRTEKWGLMLYPSTEKLIVRTSDGLRDYCNWTLAIEQQLYAIREQVRDIPAEPVCSIQKVKGEGYVIRGLDAEQERTIECVADALMECYLSPTPRTEEVHRMVRILFAKRLQQKDGESDQKNTKRNPWTLPIDPQELYLLWGPQRTADAQPLPDYPGVASQFRSKIPANWVLETLKSVVSAYKSFFALKKNADPDARTMRDRPEWRFQAISGCSAFSIKAGRIVLAPEIFGLETLSFPIPPKYQALKLGRLKRLTKFVIHRDEPDLRRPGHYTISVSYEIAKPETKPFVAEEAVFIALGASSIGIVSPKGDMIVKLWRPDKFWKPLIAELETYLGLRKKSVARPFGNVRPALTRNSDQWRELRSSYVEMNGIMAAQETQNRREVVAVKALEHRKEFTPRELRFEKRRAARQSRGYVSMRVRNTDEAEALLDRLLGHGVHFVVTTLDIRSKEGKLADASKEERGGPLGLNWAAQNTGAIGYLERWLEAKVPEFGGTVRKHKLPYEALPRNLSKGYENKIPIAKALRDDFLKSLKETR